MSPEISTFLSHYAACFGALDIDRICDHWILPATISVGGTTTVFETRDALADNIAQLGAFYKRQGLSRAYVKVTAHSLPRPDCAFVTTRYALHGANGTPLVGWDHHYVLRRTMTDWKFVFAIADGEIEAWQERGTPIPG